MHVSAANVSQPPLPRYRACFGASVAWQAGSLWDSYPYHEHNDSTLGWTPIGFDPAQNKIFFRADNCEKMFNTPGPSCSRCEHVVQSAAFRKMVDRSTHASRSTRFEYLTHHQLVQVARKHAADKKALRSKVIALDFCCLVCSQV